MLFGSYIKTFVAQCCPMEIFGNCDTMYGTTNSARISRQQLALHLPLCLLHAFLLKMKNWSDVLSQQNKQNRLRINRYFRCNYFQKNDRVVHIILLFALILCIALFRVDRWCKLIICTLLHSADRKFCHG